MISLWFAVSPPHTLLPPLTLPPRPMSVDESGFVTLQQQQTIETAGAAIANTFEGRGQTANNDIPPMPVPPRDLLEGLSGGLPMLPLTQDAHNLATARCVFFLAVRTAETQYLCR
jgi:hypothetical protein